MNQLNLQNPYKAPVYHLEQTSSTMDEAHKLASNGAVSGTVVVADMQSAGRGRVRGRSWASDKGTGLFCTLLLRYPSISDIPTALSLRVGLAASLALADMVPILTDRLKVKWPNDLVLEGSDAACKLGGILCESDGKCVFIGIGINIAQKNFPPELEKKASSILRESGLHISRDTLLEVLLYYLHRVLHDPSPHDASPRTNGLETVDWRVLLEERLYMRGRRVRFENGQAGSNLIVNGVLKGLGKDGELLIRADGETEPRAYVNGELLVYGA